ncbi:MAG: ribonuclease HII [Nitrospirales bacterium]|nr:ribonuclease HII [Nitrospirales bacterium]
MDLFEHDEILRKEGFSSIAGVDEAGRGPLAGPVVAAAVVLPKDCRIPGVNDSKVLSPAKRALLFRAIMEEAVDWAVGIVDAPEIDRINILQATRLAMDSAVRSLSEKPNLVITDAVKLPSLSIRQIPIIKGDAKSASIAAASIVAKVVRDRIMDLYHTLFPCYGFAKHKGYGTGLHLDTIRKYGPSPIHRMSFRGVKELPLPLVQEKSAGGCYG